MTLIPGKINDGSPRNSMGQLISIAVKYADGIDFGCEHYYACECWQSPKAMRARARWRDYLKKEVSTNA